MKLVQLEFVTLDGVSQGPGGPDEDRSHGFTQGGWLVPYVDEDFLVHIRAWNAEADAFLFGRRTYEAFARDWPRAADQNDPVARSLNRLPKYVASQTLQPAQATWRPTTLLTGDVMAQVAALKAQPGRELQVHGSTRLGQSLLDAGLLDELRLVIAPVVIGAGRRFFRDGAVPTRLRLTDSQGTPEGLTLQTYVVAGRPEYGLYDVA
ncbi:MAG: dihydrofolate reductase family protein [Thermomicrobiales bacterium]|nr:dihydrofolate reductase family protein [Thermomicrobiales bacterium]